MTEVSTIRELTGAELDAVSGGHPALIGVNIEDSLNNFLNDNFDNLTVEVSNNQVDILRNGEVVKNVGIGVAVAVLGAAGGAGAGVFRNL